MDLHTDWRRVKDNAPLDPRTFYGVREYGIIKAFPEWREKEKINGPLKKGL